MRPDTALKYADKVDDDLLCSICKDVLDDAVTTPCRHTFCKTCITEWTSQSLSCPLDKKRLVPSDLTPIPIAFVNLIDRLTVLCSFQEQGCNHRCPRSDLLTHIKRCPFNPSAEFECDGGCGIRLKQSNIKDHVCTSALNKIIEDLRNENEILQEDLSRQKSLESMLKRCICVAQEKLETTQATHDSLVAKLKQDHESLVTLLKYQVTQQKKDIDHLQADLKDRRRMAISSRIGLGVRRLYPQKSIERTTTVSDGLKWNILLRLTGKKRRNVEESPAGGTPSNNDVGN